MSYPVAGAAVCGCKPTHGGGYFGTAAFALVLFVLLVIILRAGY
ncbi:sporulation protein YjcZ [Cohnella sp.]